jgi:hypothetical protein
LLILWRARSDCQLHMLVSDQSQVSHSDDLCASDDEAAMDLSRWGDLVDSYLQPVSLQVGQPGENGFQPVITWLQVLSDCQTIRLSDYQTVSSVGMCMVRWQCAQEALMLWTIVNGVRWVAHQAFLYAAPIKLHGYVAPSAC